MIFHTLTADSTPVIGGPKPADFAAWFVDSVNGDDEANDGATAATPFATLARVAEETLTSSSYVLLARGSRFREELTGWTSGVKIRAYGHGARPIIDGRDPAPNASFAKTSGRTNVYEIAWTHDFGVDGGKSAHRVWEAGTMMTRAGSLAACDSTPGSFYAAAPTAGGPDTIYIHPADSSNPTTNGNPYAITKRRWAVQLYTAYKQAHLTSIETIGNAYADGSLCVDGYVEDCIARDGRIHNAFILGEAVNCQALACEAGVNSTMFVSYVDLNGFGGPLNRNVLYRGCVADAQSTMVSVSGFYAHTDGSRDFGTIEWRDCRVVGCDAGWGGLEAERFLCYRCTYDDVINAYSFYGSLSNHILGGSGNVRGGFNEGGLVYLNTTAPNLAFVIHGCKVYSPGSFGPAFVFAPFATLQMERCTITTGSGGLLKFMRGDITFRRNVVAYGNVVCTALGTADNQAESFDTDYNCYWLPSISDGAFQKLYPTQVNYDHLTDWRTYLTGVALGVGRDANSIAADPLIPGRASLDFTIGNATVLTMGAGAELDEEDDDELQAYWLTYRVTEV